MTQEERKFCMDCRHYIGDTPLGSRYFRDCLHPQCRDDVGRALSASLARLNPCGPEARFFESIPPRPSMVDEGPRKSWRRRIIDALAYVAAKLTR